MAIQWMDDFTSYGSGSTGEARTTNGPYAEAGFNLVADPDPSGTGATVCKITGNCLLRRVLSSPQTTVGVAGRYWLRVIPDTINKRPYFAELRDTNNVAHIGCTINPSGYIEVYRQDNGGSVLVASSTSPVIVANAWRHIETKFVLDAAAGSVQIKLEGVTVVNVTGIRTTTNIVGAVATASIVAMYGVINGAFINYPDMFVKDFIIWDGSGSLNNTFMGTCQVYKIVPDGDITLGWTPNSGLTGWNKINESTPDDDTGYISAASASLVSEFSLTDLPVNTTAVKGVMTVHRSKKIDGGDGNVQVSLVSGAATGAGADRAISTAYTYWSDIYEQDPGGTNWSKTLVNALHLKLNRTV